MILYVIIIYIKINILQYIIQYEYSFDNLFS